MQEMMNFVLWFIQTFPPVLLQAPFSAFTGIMLLFFTGTLVSRLMHTH